MNARFNITINWFVFPFFCGCSFFCQTALVHIERAVVTPAVVLQCKNALSSNPTVLAKQGPRTLHLDTA